MKKTRIIPIVLERKIYRIPKFIEIVLPTRGDKNQPMLPINV